MKLARCATAHVLPLLGLAAPASGQVQDPGSLLVVHEFDNRPGIATLVTLTNSSHADPVDVEWRYVSATDCQEFNRLETLTPNDTITVVTDAHNPAQDRGYVVLFARNPAGEAVVFDHLLATSLSIDGLMSFQSGVNAFSFRGIGAEGSPTDVDGDGQRDLDGIEYAAGPDQLLFPRFLGQDDLIESELVLIDLSGVGNFSAVDFLAFNDNEEIYSHQLDFQCWTRLPLSTLSGVYQNEFLQDFTNHDPGEIVGAPLRESGWFRLDGNSTVTPGGDFLPDPLVLGLLVEHIGTSSVASRPYWLGEQEVLLPPACTTDVSVALWPPNHEHHDLDLELLAGVSDPNGLDVTIAITAITQDEPVNANGDGNTVCDGDGIGSSVASLRAERQGGGNGRVYRVTYTATNTAGLSCDGWIEVTVPHSQNGTPAVDDGQAYDSTEGC